MQHDTNFATRKWSCWPFWPIMTPLKLFYFLSHYQCLAEMQKSVKICQGLQHFPTHCDIMGSVLDNQPVELVKKQTVFYSLTTVKQKKMSPAYQRKIIHNWYTEKKKTMAHCQQKLVPYQRWGFWKSTETRLKKWKPGSLSGEIITKLSPQLQKLQRPNEQKHLKPDSKALIQGVMN